jgi:zinc protease
MLLDGIEERILPNGLKIIALRKTGAPVVSVQVWYKTGSALEADGCRGISHFLEHMMFRGSRQVASEEHALRINDAGGHCNAFTAEDVTAYTNSVPRDFLDMVLALEADRIDGLTFDPALFETERSVIVEEYHAHINNPVAKAFMEFRTLFYGVHPYAISPLGRLSDITSVSADSCRDYYCRFYAPDNAVIVVVGDAEVHTIFDAAARHFTGRRARAVLPAFNREGLWNRSRGAVRRMTRKIEFDVPVLVLGFPAPPSSHPDAVVLEILQLVAAGGETSRLHREVVRHRSLAVMTGGINHLLKDTGMSMFFAAFTPDVGAAGVETAIDRELERIKNDGLTQEEMDKARNATLTNRIFELYSAENICHWIGYGETIEGNYRLWVDRLEALKNLSREKLVETARRWWNRDDRYVLVLEPRRSNPFLHIGGLARRLFGRFGSRTERNAG